MTPPTRAGASSCLAWTSNSGAVIRSEQVEQFFAELKRRRVIRALVAYGIAAFAVLQIIEPVMHGLHWPDAVLSYARWPGRST